MAESRSQFAAKETVLEMLKRKATEHREEFALPSGLNCRMTFFNGSTAMRCTKIADGDESLAYAAIIAETCEFEGEKLIAEDVRQYLDGLDWLFLLGKLSGASLQEGK
jgi:hypothetical protein